MSYLAHKGSTVLDHLNGYLFWALFEDRFLVQTKLKQTDFCFVLWPFYTRPWESRGGQADAYTMLIAQDGRHKKYSPKVRDSSRMLNKMYIHKNDIFTIGSL